jgi:hypothetical protein
MSDGQRGVEVYAENKKAIQTNLSIRKTSKNGFIKDL